MTKRTKTIITVVALLAVGIALFLLVKPNVDISRGVERIGGEYMLIILPATFWGLGIEIRKTLRELFYE